MYSMKEACTLTNMTYENLKFYCNEGLVPNVKRDRRNYRVFDEHDIKWIQSLNCLKSCGMSIAEMKQYLALCMEGEGTIPERKVILAEKKETFGAYLGGQLELGYRLEQAGAWWVVGGATALALFLLVVVHPVDNWLEHRVRKKRDAHAAKPTPPE